MNPHYQTVCFSLVINRAIPEFKGAQEEIINRDPKIIKTIFTIIYELIKIIYCITEKFEQ
jgi:hypothetical protein